MSDDMEQKAQDQIEGGIYLKEQFDEWFLEYKKICKENKCEWLASDQDDYLDYFKDGDTPSEAFSTECSYCGE